MRFGKKEFPDSEAMVVDPVRVLDGAASRRAESAGNTFEVRAEPQIVNTIAVIGPSICIKGEISGDEDLLVEGRVEGNVSLPTSRLLVGVNGTVAANIKARSIQLDGHVTGDISASETVVVSNSGVINGNIKAPRVTLQDGCKFKGTIDMDLEPSAVVTDFKASFASSQPKRTPEQQAS